MIEYEFYSDTYCGKEIVKADWGGKVRFAAAYIGRYFAGFDVSSDQYKHAVCAVAEAKQINEQGVLTSQTVGSWSKHYNVQVVSDEDRLMDAAMLYLSEYRKGVEWA